MSQPPPASGDQPQQPWGAPPPAGHTLGHPPAPASYAPPQPPSSQPYAPPGYAEPPQPQPYASSPYASPPQPYAAPPQPQPYAAPPQPYAPPLPLADRVPGAVAHDAYTGPNQGPWPQTGQFGNGGVPPAMPPAPKRDLPSGWNAPAVGMLLIFLLALGALLWPQFRARSTERKVAPLVAGLSGRDAGARCPRYITAIFTNVGSVSLDSSGRIADRTDLTGPICDGLRRLYSPAGKAELRCLVTDGNCSETALRSVVAINVVAHESMHLGGELDEAQAECRSIAAGPQAAQLLGLSPEQGRMLAYAHLFGMNPNTPDEYAVSRENCPQVAEFAQNPPVEEAVARRIADAVGETWVTLGDED